MASYNPSQFSPYPPIEVDQGQSQLHPFTHANDHISMFPFPTLLKTTQAQEVIRRDHASQEQLILQPKTFNLLLMGEQIESYSYNDHNTMDQPMCDHSLRENDPIQGSSKWMSSKMRIMKKMLSSERILMNKPKDQTVQDIQDQHQSNHESSSSSNPNHGSITIRVCSDCNTTKTPLWRSGPHGPKSLCNACGIRAIRQRKARRDMAAEEVALSGTGGGLSPVASAQITKVRKEKRLDADCTMPFKKRCRFSKLAGAAQKKKLPFDDMSMHQIYPKVERDAAISLMALSCGLILS